MKCYLIRVILNGILDVCPPEKSSGKNYDFGFIFLYLNRKL